MKEGEYYTKSLAKNHVYAKFNMQEIWKIFKGHTQTMGFLGFYLITNLLLLKV